MHVVLFLFFLLVHPTLPRRGHNHVTKSKSFPIPFVVVAEIWRGSGGRERDRELCVLCTCMCRNEGKIKALVSSPSLPPFPLSLVVSGLCWVCWGLLPLVGWLADVEVLAGSDTNQLIPLPPPHHHPTTTTTTIYPHPTLSHTQPWGGTLPPQPYQEAEGLHPATWLFQGHLAVQMEPHEEENNLPTITPWTHRAGDEGGDGVLMFNIGQSGDILKLVNRLQREEKYFNERLVRK